MSTLKEAKRKNGCYYYQSYCKACVNQRYQDKGRHRYQDNKEEICAKQRQRYQDNREEECAKQRQYYHDNKDKKNSVIMIIKWK